MYILHILLIHNYWHKIAFISSPSIRGFLKCSLTHSYCCCNKHARTSLLPVTFRVRFQHTSNGLQTCYMRLASMHMSNRFVWSFMCLTHAQDRRNVSGNYMGWIYIFIITFICWEIDIFILFKIYFLFAPSVNLNKLMNNL